MALFSAVSALFNDQLSALGRTHRMVPALVEDRQRQIVYMYPSHDELYSQVYKSMRDGQNSSQELPGLIWGPFDLYGTFGRFASYANRVDGSTSGSRGYRFLFCL